MWPLQCRSTHESNAHLQQRPVATFWWTMKVVLIDSESATHSTTMSSSCPAVGSVCHRARVSQ